MPCREQLAEAMHRIDALLGDVDDVRRSASRAAAAATESAEATEAQLKCASDWHPPAHAASLAKLSEINLLAYAFLPAQARQQFISAAVSDAIKQVLKVSSGNCALSMQAVRVQVMQFATL